MAQKLDENSRELGLLDSKVSALSNLFSNSVKTDAADRIDVEHLGHAISAFRAYEASEDIGDVMEQREQTRLVAMAVDARRRLTIDANKQIEAEWVINLDWYFRTAVMSAAMFAFIYYNKRITAWLQLNIKGFGRRSTRLQKGMARSQRGRGGERVVARDGDRGRDGERDMDRQGVRAASESHEKILENHSSNAYDSTQVQQQQRRRRRQLHEQHYDDDESVGSSDSLVHAANRQSSTIDEAIEDDTIDLIARVAKVAKLSTLPNTHATTLVKRERSFSGARKVTRNPFDGPSEATRSANKYALRWLTKAHVGGREKSVEKSEEKSEEGNSVATKR